jgi:acyl carrier protein
MKEKIKALVIDSLNELKETNNLDFDVTDETILLGENSVMDSYDFVSFVSNLEEKIADAFDKPITIVSEKAFSKKYSPFKTIDRITDYIIELMNEAE